MGEHRVDHTPQAQRPSTAFRKRDGGLTLVLAGQQANGNLPVYGRSAVVDGTVDLNSVEGLSEVYIKVRSSILPFIFILTRVPG